MEIVTYLIDKTRDFLSGSPRIRGIANDDLCDRLNSRITVIMLACFAIVIAVTQTVGTPLRCFLPAHFKKYHQKFATSYCWIKNTYYLPENEEFYSEWGNEEDRQMITYYQWIPLILIGQAFLFYLPSCIWHGWNSRSGVDADDILSSAHTLSLTHFAETRDRTLKMATNQIHRFLATQDQHRQLACDLKSILSRTCCVLCGKR